MSNLFGFKEDLVDYNSCVTALPLSLPPCDSIQCLGELDLGIGRLQKQPEGQKQFRVVIIGYGLEKQDDCF